MADQLRHPEDKRRWFIDLRLEGSIRVEVEAVNEEQARKVALEQVRAEGVNAAELEGREFHAHVVRATVERAGVPLMDDLDADYRP